jgi:hypothetical protein
VENVLSRYGPIFLRTTCFDRLHPGDMMGPEVWGDCSDSDAKLRWSAATRAFSSRAPPHGHTWKQYRNGRFCPPEYILPYSTTHRGLFCFDVTSSLRERFPEKLLRLAASFRGCHHHSHPSFLVVMAPAKGTSTEESRPGSGSLSASGAGGAKTA